MNDYIITADTDSMYIQVKELLLHRFPDIDLKNRDEVIPKILEIAQELQEVSNKFIKEFSNRAFNIKSRKNYFNLKQEVIIERGYFAGKRRYATFIVNKEGISIDSDSKDALDIKGLDLMKSNFPKVFKNFGEKLIKDIMFGKSKKDIDKEIIDFKYSIQNLTWKQLSKPTGLKTLDEYIEYIPKKGEIFSRLKIKCPINAKSAIYYNDLLKFKKLDSKYPMFQVGAKMYIAYLKDNPYKINCIGFYGSDDPPEIIEFIEKYIDKDKLFEAVMKNKLENLYSDLNWGPIILNKSVNKFFSFK